MRAFNVFVAIAFGALLCGCQTLNDVVSSGPDAKPAESAPPPAPAVVAGTGAAASGSMAGMSADTLRSLWGEPTLKRTETGAEMWQYRGNTGGCTLLVYLYSGAVTHAEAVPGGADEAAVAACAKAAGKPPLKPMS